MSSYIPPKDLRKLLLRSGGRCAIPECRKVLIIDKTQTDDESIIAEMAHIKGERPGAARYDLSMTEEERRCYENRILVSRDCHKMIDDQEKTYTVERLHEIKEEHEKWIIKQTEKEVIEITFAELSVVTRYLVSGQSITDESLKLIPPREKIKRNRLSLIIEQMIIMGMTQVKQVEDFINKCADSEFGNRLKEGFIREYERLKNEENLIGDDLFENLHDFASGGSTDFKQRAAGLAVLVYLFEKCEVFENDTP